MRTVDQHLNRQFQQKRRLNEYRKKQTKPDRSRYSPVSGNNYLFFSMDFRSLNILIIIGLLIAVIKPAGPEDTRVRGRYCTR